MTSAKKIFPRDPELFLRILCDSLSCSIAIEIEKKTKFMETKNKNENKNSKEYSSEEDSAEVVPQLNIIEPMIYLLFDIAVEIGVNISTILSSMLKNQKCDPLREIVGSPKEMTAVPNSKTNSNLLRISCEFGSGFVSSVIFLFAVVDCQRCQEVRIIFF